MRKIYPILLSAMLVGCGGGGNSTNDDIGLSGRYVGTLEGVSCATNEQVAIDVTHDVAVPRPESSEEVTVVDDQGRVYRGVFSFIVRPDGNVYGFSVRRESDGTSWPVAFSYNFAGFPTGRAGVVGFSTEGLTGGCDEFSGQVQRVSD